MSKYLTFPDVVFKNLQQLIAALAELGYTRVEQGANLALNGWGNQRQTADVIIRKKDIKATYGDVGFRKTPDGYVPVIDDLDASHIHGGKFIPALKTAVGKRTVQNLATSLHGTTRHRVEGKKIIYTISYN